MTIQNYIKNKKNNKFSLRGIPIEIQNKTTLDYGDIKNTIEKSFSMVPDYFIDLVRQIKVGHFEYLKNKDLQAAYHNKVIYISGEIDNTKQLLSFLIHEIAHAVETSFSQLIFSDGKIEKEFLIKRKQAWQALKQKGFNIELHKSLKTDYDDEFDFFLYKKVGYTVLGSLTANIFHSPYAMTSLREYFADGFEAFFMNDNIYLLKKVSPILFFKISSLLKIQDDYYV
jgi:hypothetical protein